MQCQRRAAASASPLCPRQRSQMPPGASRSATAGWQSHARVRGQGSGARGGGEGGRSSALGVAPSSTAGAFRDAALCGPRRLAAHPMHMRCSPRCPPLKAVTHFRHFLPKVAALVGVIYLLNSFSFPRVPRVMVQGEPLPRGGRAGAQRSAHVSASPACPPASLHPASLPASCCSRPPPPAVAPRRAGPAPASFLEPVNKLAGRLCIDKPLGPPRGSPGT